MAYTTIDKSTLHHNTSLWSGNSSTQTITGVGFQPDMVWLKQRSSTQAHALYDVIRGVTKYIASNTTGAEATQAQGLTAFNSDGYALGTDEMNNDNGDTYVGWNWKANGAGSANTDGSISSTVSANTTAGFSIVKYTGTGSNATIGHGLGVAPKMILQKNIADTESWMVYHASVGATKYMVLNTTAAQDTNSTRWNNTAPTSTLFSIGTDTSTNGSGEACIAYCFAEIPGYSKFGSYTGNNGANGTFIYTGFKPSFLITKSMTTAEGWIMQDNKRKYNVATAVTGNPKGYPLYASANSAGNVNTWAETDLLSNGFKLRVSHGQINGTATHIYMAFGQTIVGTNNQPCSAI